MHSAWDSDYNLPPSPDSSDSSFDEDEVNRRITPYWPNYRSLFQSRGFRLDTVRDVKEYYKRRQELDATFLQTITGYPHAGEAFDDDSLCPDAGLVSVVYNILRLI